MLSHQLRVRVGYCKNIIIAIVVFSPVSHVGGGDQILSGTTSLHSLPGCVLTWCSMHLWSLISSEMFLLQTVMHAVPFFFILRLHSVYENPFLLSFPLCCCLSVAIAITVHYSCHFKDLQWNDNPLFGGILTCYQTNSPCFCCCSSQSVITFPKTYICVGISWFKYLLWTTY